MNYQFRAGAVAPTETRPGHSRRCGDSASRFRSGRPFLLAAPQSRELQMLPAGARRRAEWGTRAGHGPGAGGEGTPALAVASPGSVAALPPQIVG